MIQGQRRDDSRAPLFGSKNVLCAGLALAFLFSSLTTGNDRVQEDEKPLTLGERVNIAIQKGVKFLKERQKEDGSFESTFTSGFPDGAASLCLLALLKSGVQPGDPLVGKTLTYLKEKPYTRTYSTAVRILALEALKSLDAVDNIKAAAGWLVDQFRWSEGEWAYPDHATDLSNTQYAVLGLWTAERQGFKAPRELWSKLGERILRHQNPDGGYGYRLNDQSSGSMTTAGITVLTICMEHLRKNDPLAPEIRGSLERAWGYMDRRFHPGGNPVGEYAFQKAYYFYYLYGLERACAVGDRKEVGGKDWYQEGATELLRIQQDNGSWGDSADTAFALLFLRLSTYTSMRKQHATNLGRTTSGSRPKKITPAVEIPFVRRWLVLGPLDDPDESALGTELIREDKVEPRPGQVTKRLKWTACRSIKPFFDLTRAFPGARHAVAYAFTNLQADEPMEGILWFGGDDGARIRLDGRLIHDMPFRHHEGPDTHSIPITLSKGRHGVLVKLSQWEDKWGFYLRITGSDGSFPEGLIPFVDPKGPTPLEYFDAAAPRLSIAEIYDLIPLDKKPKLCFDSAEDLDRIAVADCNDAPPFEWSLKPAEETGSRPNPGAEGVICVHPVDVKRPVRIYRKIKVVSNRSRIIARLSACTPEVNEKADWIARLGVYDGTLMQWLHEEVISAPKGWQEITTAMNVRSGTEALVVLECACGGPGGDWYYDQAFIDEFSIKHY